MIESISKKEELNQLKQDENYTIFCEEDENYYQYKNGTWVLWDSSTTKAEGGVQMSLYEINKQIISQLPDFEESQWEGAKQVLLEWLVNKNNDYFYMLYGKEVSYFTVFHKELYSGDAEFETLFEALKECLCQFTVKSFDITEDKTAIEIWVKIEENITCMYLFPYDEGVVTYSV